MKKIKFVLILVLLVFVFAAQAEAAGLIKATSRFYFLQSWGESIRLFFTFSPEAKLNYAIDLADRRAEEINSSASDSAAVAKLSEKYIADINQAEKISTQVEDKTQAAEKIKEANLNQQQVLAEAYQKAPEEVLAVITDAQENSLNQVEKVISETQGPEAAQQYVQQVTQIQQVQRLERAELMPMESNPNAEPSQNAPNELYEIKEGQNLNPINPIQEGTDGNTEGQGGTIKPVEPVQMQQPAAPLY